MGAPDARSTKTNANKAGYTIPKLYSAKFMADSENKLIFTLKFLLKDNLGVQMPHPRFMNIQISEHES